MKISMDVKSIEWWFWAVTFAFIIAALSGWTPGYAAVMIISALQVVYFSIRTGSPRSFPSQVRIVYFACTLLGFWEVGRIYWYAVLFLGTAMVVFCNRCGIALVLKLMPWNKDLENPQCKLPGA